MEMGRLVEWKTTGILFHFLLVAVVVLTNFADSFTTTVVHNGNSNHRWRPERKLKDRPRRQRQQIKSSLDVDTEDYTSTKTSDKNNVNIDKSFGNKHEKKWIQQYEKLKSFQKANGNCNVPIRNPDIGNWVMTQRSQFKKGVMSQERIDLLNAVGFVWSGNVGKRGPSINRWNGMYEQLKEFKMEHGHFSVEYGSSLRNWMSTQRVTFRKGILSEQRIALLEEIGFPFNGHDSTWQDTYNELEDFYKNHGHLDVSLSNAQLNKWIRLQRKEKIFMDPWKVEMLDRLGLVWEDVHDERNQRRWNARWEEMKEFQKMHGHLKIPVGDSLYRWVCTQKTARRRGLLSEYRIEKLDSIGFVWKRRNVRPNNYLQDRWLEYYEELKDYRSEHGHFNVKIGEDAFLRKWVLSQRREFKYGYLRKDRRLLLEEIDFVWDARKETRNDLWRQKFDELRAFHKEFGHVQVTFSGNRPLCFWLRAQRKRFESGRLEPERQKMMDDLDPEWTKG